MNSYNHPHTPDFGYDGPIPNGRQRFYIEPNADAWRISALAGTQRERVGTDLRPPGFGRNTTTYVANEVDRTGVDVEMDQRPSNEPDDVDGRVWSTLSPYEQDRDVIFPWIEPDNFVLRTIEEQADGIERMVTRVPVHRVFNPVARLPWTSTHHPPPVRSSYPVMERPVSPFSV